MDPFFEASHLQLRAEARAWVEGNLLSGGPKKLALEDEARALVEQLGHAGLLAYIAPKAYGGVRDTVQARDLCILREELARGSSLADVMFAVQALGSYPIIFSGNKQQKNRYIPPLAQGKSIAAFALTEPEAGSDISSIATRAVRRGKEYILNGVKHLVSNAGLAETYVIFAVTAPRNRKKQISVFVVEADTPGLVFKERLSLISPHPIGTIALEDCRVSEKQLLAGEGEGFRIALTTLNTLRCTVGAAAVGLAQRAMEEAIRFSLSRRQFGQSLSRFQGIQFKLADMVTELEASRLIVNWAAWSKDQGEGDITQRASMAKLFATEAAQRIVDQALQIHGGRGLVSGTPVEQLYRDVRALRIYEGTSEIQKIIIARTLLGKSK
jgi:acyl-CoA dehydrogenase